MNSTVAEFKPLGSLGCNFCVSSRTRAAGLSRQRASESHSLAIRVAQIKASRGKNLYDCIVGVSGGVDSSWVLIKAVEMGLRPLAVHMDNNWNSAEANQNLHRLLDYLKVDLFTVVTDWETQRNLQLSMMKADVIDLELLYDNCLHAVCYTAAKDFKVKFILGGTNNTSEGVEVPASWGWIKWDGRNVRKIADKFGVGYEGYPLFSTFRWFVSTFLFRIKWVDFLDLLPEYSKQEAENSMVQWFKYRPYALKHYENVFTRFYQGFILPVKFGVDKRLVHYSSLIVSGQMSKADARARILGSTPYESERQLRLDRRLVLGKLNMGEKEFDDYLLRPKRLHQEFGTDRFRVFVWLPLLRLKHRLDRLR